MTKFATKFAEVYSCNEAETDAVISACLLHDVVKRGIQWGKHTTAIHDLEGAMFIERVAKKYNLESTPMLSDIIMAVKWHYGRWSKREEGKVLDFFKQYTPIMQIVHLADVASADKDVHRYSLEESLLG